jgi:hypothetical protein
MSASAKTAKTENKEGRDNLTPFLPGIIDDYPFTPEEFRVLMRVVRRTVGGGDCYETIPSFAKTLNISERLVRRAVRVLEKCRAIVRTARPGTTSLYEFNPCENWKPKDELAAIRAKIDAKMKQADRARKAARKTVVVAETQGVKYTPTPCGNDRGVVAETQGLPLAETQDKGYPIQGYPIKEKTTDADASLSSTFPSDEIVEPSDLKSQPTKSATGTYATNDSPKKAPPETHTTSAPKEQPAPTGAAETFWDVWVGIQKKQGVLEQSARARLGKLIKEFGTELVASAISENLSTKADAFAYLKATLTKLREKKGADDLQAEQWLGEQTYVKDDFSRQMIQNPYHGDPRFLPNFSVPKLIPEWYRATAERLQSRQGGTHVI